MPSLRKRPGDLPLLIGHFVGESSRRHGKRIAEVSAEAMERLLAYRWPGNVRELQHELSQAVVLTPPGQAIGPGVLLAAVCRAGDGGRGGEPRGVEGRSPLTAHRRQAEREVIVETLQQVGWNVTAAARVLGISRVGLTRKLKALGIRRPGRSPAARPDRKPVAPRCFTL